MKKNRLLPLLAAMMSLLLCLCACGKTPAASSADDPSAAESTAPAESGTTTDADAAQTTDGSSLPGTTQGRTEGSSSANTTAKTAADGTKTTRPTSPATTSGQKDPQNPVKVVKSLQNSAYKLAKEKKLTVGYIGGSVTVGVGSSDQNTRSWRALTTKWLKDTYPSASITEANAAISGTGSLLGAGRIMNELIDSYHPDLIFVEFAVNDRYQGYTYDQSERYWESLVRMVLAADPYTDIVFVLTTDRQLCGMDSDATLAAKAVAERYGLYVANVGKTLAERESDAFASGGKYFSDFVHPAYPGHAKYAEYVTELLASELKIGARTAHAVPSAGRSDLFKKATFISVADLVAANPGMGRPSGDTKTSGGALDLSGGDALTVKFSGTALAMRWKTTDGVDVSLRMDGQRSALPVGNPDGAQQLLYEGLAGGSHTLKIVDMGGSKCRINGLYVFE